MKDSFKECCSKRYEEKLLLFSLLLNLCLNRIWDKWTFPVATSFLMPDVSRTFRRPIDGNRLNTKYLETLFNQKRKTSL